MNPQDTIDVITDIAERVAAAIGRRDGPRLRAFLAAGFVHRTHGGAASDAEAFVRGIEQIPGEIRFVRLEQMAVDVFDTGAMATGAQHAQVVVDGQLIDDKRRFIDWFVKEQGEWRIQAAVDIE